MPYRSEKHFRFYGSGQSTLLQVINENDETQQVDSSL